MIEKYERIINNLSYEVYNLSSSISSFNSVKSQLADLITRLNKESNKVEKLANQVKAYYSVDGVGIDNKIMDNKEDIDSAISYINSIITGVDSKISDVNRKIDNNNDSIWYYKKKIKELKENGESWVQLRQILIN